MITDFDSLQSTIADFSHRTDLSVQIPTFIQLAEANFSANIRSRNLEIALDLITSGGVCTLPDDYGSMKSIQILGGYNTILQQVSSNNLLDYNASNSTGVSRYYSIQGNSLLLSPIPDDGVTVSIVYDQNMPPLSSNNPVNWVLSKYPFIYLYGSLIELSVYINDATQVQFYQMRYDQAVEDMWQNYALESFSGSPLSANNDYIVDYYE